MFGLGLTIIVGQLPKLLGVPAGDGDFFAQAGHLAAHLGDTNPWTAAVGLGSLAGHGVEVIGEIEGAVPLPAIPAVGWDELVELLGGAAAVAVIGYAESATVAESMANEHGYTVEPDRELRAVGAANILSGLFQGFITGGGAASRPPTTAPGPRPSWSRCWCPA